MDLQHREVYVPERRPAGAGGAAGREAEDWPRPVFTPGAERREGTLAARVREALGPGPGGDGSFRGPELEALFRSPEVARDVVRRLSREARDRGCTLVAAAEPGGGLVAAPVAVEAGLPLLLAAGADGGPETAGHEDAGGRTSPSLVGGDDRVLVVGEVARSGERLAEAVGRVEEAGGRVAAVAVVVEVGGGGSRGKMSEYNCISILEL